MFIKLTHTVSSKSIYININMMEAIDGNYKGSTITTITDAFYEPNSWSKYGYDVKETPEQIIEMIEEMKK